MHTGGINVPNLWIDVDPALFDFRLLFQEDKSRFERGAITGNTFDNSDLSTSASLNALLAHTIDAPGTDMVISKHPRHCHVVIIHRHLVKRLCSFRRGVSWEAVDPVGTRPGTTDIPCISNEYQKSDFYQWTPKIYLFSSTV